MLMHLGSIPVVVVSNADVARLVLKTHELTFLNRRVVGVLNKLTYNGKDNHGEYWKQIKGFLVHHLLSKERVGSFHEVRKEELDLMIHKIGETCGSVVNFSELISSLSINVICRLVLGRKYNGKKFENMVEQPKKLVFMVTIGQYIPWLSWLDDLIGINGKIQKVVKEYDEFIEEQLRPKFDQENCLSDILLRKLLEAEHGFEYSRETIKAMILDIFTGATDTAFTALEWAFSELVRNPRVMKTLQKQVDSITRGKLNINEDDLEKLNYLNAVVKETLRLHPPAPIIPRASTQDVRLMGYNIESGTRVFINVWAIGRDPSVWEEPEEFKPERFLNPNYDFKGSHFEFIPFGAGRRGCPGVHFATIFMKLVIANTVYKFDLSVSPGDKGENLDMSESTAFTVHRKNPLLLVATRRYEFSGKNM
ncbi:cytochrome P450 Tp4149-like [Rutidosis leptorrhynchoides]|uniref:cytochrome P450 Tp4149-like n=1 Tax=Rutidosis leptorrhynchoides TaxID=125765 RepID=UPI003A9A163D